MSGRRKVLGIGALAALAPLGGLGLGLWQRNEDSPPSAAPDAVLRLFAQTLQDTRTTPQPLAQWKGQVLVANFWATWCPPCREEMPSFSRLAEEFSGKGVQFAGIAVDSLGSVQEFSRDNPVRYPLLIADGGAIAAMRALGNPSGALPFTVVIDRQGTLREVRLGMIPEAQMRRILSDLVDTGH